MMHVDILPATAELIEEVAENMRQADRDEVWAGGKLLPRQALSICVAETLDPYVGLVNGETACAFGIGRASLLADIGTPWFLSTPVVEEYPITFARACKRHFDLIKGQYPLLVNYVDARHKAAIRWLLWLGFTLEPAKPYGPFGMKFHRFEMRV